MKRITILLSIIFSTLYAQFEPGQILGPPLATTNEFSVDFLRIFFKEVSVAYEIHSGSKLLGLRFNPYLNFDNVGANLTEYSNQTQIKFDRLADYWRVGLNLQLRYYQHIDISLIQFYFGLFFDLSYSKSILYPSLVVSEFITPQTGLLLGIKIVPFKNLFLDFFVGYGIGINRDVIQRQTIANTDSLVVLNGFLLGFKI